jgi:hypothetical protein
MLSTKTITWAQVLEVHRTQQAVNFVGEKIASIICSPTQNKFVSDEKIVYSIPKRKQYLKLIEGMKSLISTNGPINIFVKKDKNIWIDAGYFNLISFEDETDHIDFILEK